MQNIESHNAYYDLLMKVASKFIADGARVIPLRGVNAASYSDAKRPAIKGYLNAKSNYKSCKEWFRSNRFGGLGMLTGSRSRVIVVDIDKKEIVNDFEKKFFDLLETRVETGGRGLPRYFFRIPPGVSVQSIAAPGVDLLGDKKYIVLAPTVSPDGKRWLAKSDCPIKEITIDEVNRITSFVNSYKSNFAEKLIQRSVSGRNNALFVTAIEARDCGVPKEHYKQATMKVFIDLPGEQEPDRKSEFQRTVDSAYSRPARTRKSNGLDNAIREKLLQENRAAAFVVEKIFQTWGAGATFSIKDAIEIDGIGRKSLAKALNYFTECPICSKHVLLVRGGGVLISTGDRTIEQEITGRGRRSTYYTIPDLEDLRAQLGTKPTMSDCITMSDLESAKSYRDALQREFIRRRPGEHSQRSMAKRLGVTTRTIRRMHKRIGIQQKHNYKRTSPVINNLYDRPELCDWGLWLEDESGKKYPPLKAVAATWIARGKKLSLVKQTANSYWIPRNLVESH